MFREWLSGGGDWSKVAVAFERKVSSKKEFKKGHKGMKPRDIISTYGEEKLVLSLRFCLSFLWLFQVVLVEHRASNSFLFGGTLQHCKERQSFDVATQRKKDV